MRREKLDVFDRMRVGLGFEELRQGLGQEYGHAFELFIAAGITAARGFGDYSSPRVRSGGSVLTPCRDPGARAHPKGGFS
jgi:hypothetical protein